MLSQKIFKINVSDWLKMELWHWHPLTGIKAKDQQGEEEKGVISERNRLIIDLFQCMFAHCYLTSVN